MILEQIVIQDKEILGGVPVFKGTRVTVTSLLDYLEEGMTVEEYLAHFPTVKKEQVIHFLEITTREYLTKHYEIAA